MGKSRKTLSLSLNKDSLDELHPADPRHVVADDGLTQLTALQEHIGWSYNGILTGIYFKFAGDIWKATLKAEMAAGPRVSYFTGSSLGQLVETVHWYCSKGLVSWTHDKLPVRVSTRKGVRPSTFRS